MAYFYKVLVADITYHGNEPLTYACAEKLALRTVVHAPLRDKNVLGIVVANATSPRFATKECQRAGELPALPAPQLALLQWLYDYYPAPLGTVTQLFLPKLLNGKEIHLTPQIPQEKIRTLPPLTPDQQQALNIINGPGTFLLHGQTGTGKTRVYVELARRCVAAGKSAIILTPEIGLSSQLAQDFRQVFGDQVFVIHSRLSETQRRAIWLTILGATEPVIVVGARSALFSPLQNVGLIAVDECHEPAYKQDQAPHYHAIRVASKLGELYNAPVILGSATPSISDYFIASAKKRPIIPMHTVAVASTTTTAIEVVDLRERSEMTKSAHLSDKLLRAIQETLDKGEQALLFLNRRGTARAILCESCGWQALCPHCDIPLIYHGDAHRMRCHSCSHATAVPLICPECSNTDIIFKTVGTKAIASEVASFFPGARINRFDTDNKKGERVEEHYKQLRDGEIDILVGTQTLAKGLDLPKLHLVGIINADTGFSFPDFSAQERTYQLLVQVIGRVARGHRPGRVILQTYNPTSPIIRQAVRRDWTNFYNDELAERQRFLFPPFCYLLKISCRRSTSRSAQQAATTFAKKLASFNLPIIIEGPAPAFHEKIQGKYVWQLIIKSKTRPHLQQIVASLPSGWRYDIDPLNLL